MATCITCPGAENGVQLCDTCFEDQHTVQRNADTGDVTFGRRECETHQVRQNGIMTTVIQFLRDNRRDNRPMATSVVPNEKVSSERNKRTCNDSDDEHDNNLSKPKLRKRTKTIITSDSEDDDHLSNSMDLDDVLDDFVVADNIIEYESDSSGSGVSDESDALESVDGEDEEEDENEAEDDEIAEVTADELEPSWPQLDELPTIHVPPSTFISVSIAPTIRNIDAKTVDNVLHAILDLTGDSAEGIKKYLSPLALLRLRKLGERVDTAWEEKNVKSEVWRFRGTDLGVDHNFIREKTLQVKNWLKSKNKRATFQKVWLKDLVSHLMRPETDITDVNWKRCISMVFPLLEMSYLGGGWNRRAIGDYFAGEASISELLETPRPSVPKQQKKPRTPFESEHRIAARTTEFWDLRGNMTPTSAIDQIRQEYNQEQFLLSNYRDLGSVTKVQESIADCRRLRNEYVPSPAKELLYRDKLRDYTASEVMRNKALSDLAKWRYGQWYQAAIERFRAYEKTWSAEAGSLKNLYDILAQAWTRLKDKAVNPKVLGRGLSIMFNGVSNERTFGPLTETEARELGPVLTVETLGGIERKTFSVPLMFIKFLPNVSHYNMTRQGETPVFSEGGSLAIHFRKHDTPSDKRQMSKRASIYVNSDGSCFGTRRGQAIMPFLSVWDKQFARVSQTLGKLLGHCVFCRKRISRKASLKRGSGDTCFKKLGIAVTTGGLVLERTSADDVVANVRVDRATEPTIVPHRTDDETDPIDLTDTSMITLLTCDGPYVTARHDPLIQKSGMIQDLLNDHGGADDAIQLPDFIDKAVLGRLSKYAAGEGRRDEDMVQIVKDLRAYDFLGVDCKETVEEIGKSVGSVLAGRLEGVV